ncbi:hypothetical protein IL306_010696 [Fusarium sp. DS 682]|nr:hypothetical protein IL306_010696 [Fusarium sp. DS 682]
MFLPGSYYTELAEEFQKHVMRKPRNATDRFKLAQNIVNQSLKKRPYAWFWYGSFSSLTRFLDTFAWRTVWDWILWRMFDLGKLQKAHAAKVGEGRME